MRGAVVVVAVAMLVGPLCGCTPEAPHISISRILIDGPPEFDGAKDARAAVRAAIRARLAADETITGFVRRPDATHRVRIRVYPAVVPAGVEAVATGEGDSEVEAGAEERSPRPPVETEAGAEEPAPRRPIEVALESLGSAPSFLAVGDGGDAKDVATAIEAGFADAWPVLGAQRRLNVHKDGALIAALDDPDLRIESYAIEQLGERHCGAAVEPLLRVLKRDKGGDLVLRAVGALVAIGDRAAVAPLIDLTHQRDPRFVLQIVFAVAAIGGRTAEGFLVTLASGYPHPEVQRGAKDALAEMKKRRSAGGG